MFDGIKSVFRPPPREAQPTDTRMEIKRHDPDQERKKRDKRKKTTQELFEEADGATVTVDALHVFLENFLESQNAVADESFSAAVAGVPAGAESVQISQEIEKKNENHGNGPDGLAARAAQTYQNMAQCHEPQREHILGDASLEKGPEIALGSEDVRTIHRLLNDLKKLEARDIHYLRIEKEENFLQSIVTAVAKVS